ALSSQFCVPINAPPGGGLLFTVEPQLPVPGAPRPLGLDWCLQLTNVSVDLYPGNTLALPPELDPIGSQQFALHLRACFGLDCLEIVDLVTVTPTNLEDMLECYLRVVLRLGVLPRLIVPMENLVLDITRMLQDNDTPIGQHVTLVPAAVPADVPNNPAVEDDQLKVFFNLKVTAV